MKLMHNDDLTTQVPRLTIISVEGLDLLELIGLTISHGRLEVQQHSELISMRLKVLILKYESELSLLPINLAFVELCHVPR